MYEIIERKRCVITGSEDMESLYVFKNFPVHQNTTTSLADTDLLLDLEYDICRKSGMIQVRKLVPENVLYNGGHSRSIGGVWQSHHKHFAEFVRQYKPEKVFEIGGGAGYIEKYFNEKTTEHVSWTILEPNPDPINGSTAEYERGFYDEAYEIKTSFDTVIFSHLFEHMYNPVNFVSSLSKKMKIGNKLIFSVPDMQSMLLNMQTNTLNFEHTFYLAENYIDYLIFNNGFKILDKEHYKGHSIFYAVERERFGKRIALDSDLYETNKRKFENFIQNYLSFTEEIMKKIKKAKKQKIYLFGAHLFSQFLLGFGIDEKYITAILDNDKKKHERRLQGCSLICKSPQVLKNEIKPIVILRAGTYQEEIKKDILENINPNTVFWE